MDEKHAEQLKKAAWTALALTVGGYGVKLVRKNDLVGYVSQQAGGFSLDLLKDGRNAVTRVSGNFIFGRDNKIEDLELDDRDYTEEAVAEVVDFFPVETPRRASD